MNRRHADVPSEDIRSDSGFAPRDDMPLCHCEACASKPWQSLPAW
ncbi:MAG: hypothetical protein R6V02_01240 [Candidatus Aminicenantes bacterium]